MCYTTTQFPILSRFSYITSSKIHLAKIHPPFSFRFASNHGSMPSPALLFVLGTGACGRSQAAGGKAAPRHPLPAASGATSPQAPTQTHPARASRSSSTTSPALPCPAARARARCCFQRTRAPFRSAASASESAHDPRATCLVTPSRPAPPPARRPMPAARRRPAR